MTLYRSLGWVVDVDESFDGSGVRRVHHYFATVFPFGQSQAGWPCPHRHRSIGQANACGRRISFRALTVGVEHAPILSPGRS